MDIYIHLHYFSFYLNFKLYIEQVYLLRNMYLEGLISSNKGDWKSCELVNVVKRYSEMV